MIALTLSSLIVFSILQNAMKTKGNKGQGILYIWQLFIYKTSIKWNFYQD